MCQLGKFLLIKTMPVMRLYIISICLLLIIDIQTDSVKCQDDNLEHSHKCALKVIDAKLSKSVCVCNASYCDKLLFEWPQKSGDAHLIQSTKSGLRFDVREFLPDLKGSGPSPTFVSDAIEMNVDLTGEHQSILGFGGAFTDSAGLNIQSLRDGLGRKVIENYFGEHGSQYTLGRVVISGSDFSIRPYSYDDMPADENNFNLTNWSLAPEDHDYKIALIREANRIMRRHNRKLNLFGSSWSPPAFMKTSKSLIRGHLIDSDQVYTSYANYLMKFYDAYKKHGIKFWGGTVENEPIEANYERCKINSLQMSSEETIKFVANYLGPALVANNYTKDNFKLMIHDDNIDVLENVTKIVANEEVHKYVAGVAFHWYSSGKLVSYDVLNECYEKVKAKIEFMLSTEASILTENGEKPVDLGSWERGEKYALDIIETLRRHSSGWVDWNMALNEQGGPSWSHGTLDSPVIVSNDGSEFYKQPMYHVLAHFSRFLRPGSVRVDMSPEVISDDDQLLSVAVHKKDTGHVVINVLNKSPSAKTLVIKVANLSKVVIVEGKSMNTVVMKL